MCFEMKPIWFIVTLSIVFDNRECGEEKISHIVSIEEINYLVFNEHEYFYIGNLNNKYPISKFREILGS